MKQRIFFILLIIICSCDSKPSTVCDGIDANQMCFNFKTSEITIQHWKTNGIFYTLEISNQTAGSDYQDDIFLSIQLYDAISDTLPQPGVYKGGSYINPGVHTKQFTIDFYLNGSHDYKLDLPTYPQLEIISITGETLHGIIIATFVNNQDVSDKQALHVNFDNTWHL